MIMILGFVAFALVVGSTLIVLHKAAEIRDNLSAELRSANDFGVDDWRVDRFEGSGARALGLLDEEYETARRICERLAQAPVGIVETIEPSDVSALQRIRESEHQRMRESEHRRMRALSDMATLARTHAPARSPSRNQQTDTGKPQ